MNPRQQNRNLSTVDNGPDKRGDTLLVLAACSGDSYAFVKLSKPHSKRVLLTLYRITKNWQDAEDALQEALMKAFLHLDSFQGKANFSTWFTSIAVNSALMLLRKRRNVLEIALDNPGEVGAYPELNLKDSRDNPEQCFERQQRSNLIQSGILQLPPALRKVVELHHSKDLSNKEIAQCLGISLAATKSRLLRARKALRIYVQREAGRSPTRVEPAWAKRPAFPIDSDNVSLLRFLRWKCCAGCTKLWPASRPVGGFTRLALVRMFDWSTSMLRILNWWPGTLVFGYGGLGGIMTLQSDLSVDADEPVMDAAGVPDTLVSLMHLVYWNDGEAGLVQLYARQLEDRLRGVEALLRSSDPNVREARARLCN